MNALFSSYMRRLNVRHAYLPAFLVLGSVSFPGAAEAQWSPYNSTGFYSNENDNYSEDGNYTVTWWMNTYGSWNAVQIISGDLSNRKNSTGSWTSIGNAGYANVGANSWYQYDKNETGKANGTQNYWMSTTVYDSSTYTYYYVDNYLDVTVARPIPQDSMDVQETYGFVARYGDINGDGRTDFFLQRTSGGDPNNGVIYKIFLMQAADGTFSAKLRSSSDRNSASSWPVVQSSIRLLDINLDGSVDVIIRGLDNVVPNTVPQIVFSSGQLYQQQAANVLPVDAQFTKLVDELRSYYLDNQYYNENATWVTSGMYEPEWNCQWGYSGDNWEYQCTSGWVWIDTSHWSYAAFEPPGWLISLTIDDVLNSTDGTFQEVIDIFAQILGVNIGNVTGTDCNPDVDEIDSDGHCLTQIVSQIFVRLSNAVEEAVEYLGRPPGAIYVTGRILDWESNYTDLPVLHTAIEYTDTQSGLPATFSAIPNSPINLGVGNWKLIHHEGYGDDDPRNMLKLGTVLVGTPIELAEGQLLENAQAYCDCANYWPSPDWPVYFSDRYNSNSYTYTLIHRINGTFELLPGLPNILDQEPPGLLPGWNRLLPDNMFSN